MKRAYHFAGTVFPERENFSMSQSVSLSLNTRIPSGEEVTDEVTISISNSKLSVQFKTSQTNPNLADLKIRVEDYVSAIADAHGYLVGYAFQVDVATVVDPEGRQYNYGTGAAEIAETRSERPLDLMALLDTVTKTRSLPRVLRDLRSSINLANDTPLFCYRSIETIRQHFEDASDGGRREERGWEKMRRELRVNRSWLDYVQGFALPNRHGGLTPVTAAERVKIMLHTWKVVDRFVIYAHRGFVSLPECEFEFLESQNC